MNIALIADYDPANETHVLTEAALQHSAKVLNADLSFAWVATADITPGFLDGLHGVWIGPGSPYRDMERTLQLIQEARLNRVPCFGTCAGLQHMVIEYARNQVGIGDAQHAEYDPYASPLIVSKLSCSLAGREMQLSFEPGSRVATLYGNTTARERYYCNFGINPTYATQISDAGFRIVGSDAEGEARVMELADHPFFIGTLYVPQFYSTFDCPHPLVTAFVRAAVAFAEGAPHY